MKRVQTKQPIALITMGYPGAGKTNFSRQFSSDQGFVHLWADRIRYELFDDPIFSEEENDVVYRLMDYMLEEFLKAGQNVIYDASVNRVRHRKSLRALTKKLGARELVVWVQTDIDTSFDRASSRDRRHGDDKYTPSVAQDVFERISDELQRPMTKEDVVVISGKHVFNTQRQTVLRKLTQLGLIGEPVIAKPKTPRMTQRPQTHPMLGGRIDMNRRRGTTR